jgi:hypothetical protein
LNVIVVVPLSAMMFNRALSFTVVNGDVVHPLATFVPHAQLGVSTTTGRRALYLKRRSRAIGSYEGSAVDFSHCGLTAKLEAAGPKMRPLWHFTGLANNWLKKTPEDLDISSYWNSTRAPIVKGGSFVLGTTARTLRAVDIDLGITIEEFPAVSGSQGRQTFICRANPPTIKATVPWDSDFLDAWAAAAGTTYNCEMTIGENGDGTDVAAIYGFIFVRCPAVQVVNVQEVDIGGQTQMELTLKAVQSTATNETDLFPIYIGIAGKST